VASPYRFFYARRFGGRIVPFILRGFSFALKVFACLPVSLFTGRLFNEQTG
jgi:hypothetical protein